MSFFKKIFVILAMVGLMAPSFVFADSFGLDKAANGTDLLKPQGSASEAIPNLIGDIVAVALSFVGAIFFLLILYAGFLWMTAFGSSEKVDKAKDILLHAVIGLVIVLAAYAISKFVFNALTGVVDNSPQPSTPAVSADALCATAFDETSCTDTVGDAGQSLCLWTDGGGCTAL